MATSDLKKHIRSKDVDSLRNETSKVFMSKLLNSTHDSPFIPNRADLDGHLSTHNVNKSIILMSDKASKMLVRLSFQCMRATLMKKQNKMFLK